MSAGDHPRNKLLFFSIGLLLVFLASRLIAIEQFPMFTDEAFHIRYARNVIDKGIFSNAEEGRQITIWLYTLAQADRHVAVFVARAVTIIAVLPGLAALIASGSLLAGFWGAIFAGLLYFFSLYHMFFERMALADPVSASFFCIGLYFTIRLVRRTALRDALLAGIMLFLAFGAKVSALPFLATPLAGALFLNRRSRTWRESLRWAAVALTAGVGLSALFVALLRWRGHDPFFYLLRGTDQASGTQSLIALLLDRIPHNIASNYTSLSGFLGPVGLLLVAALFYLAWRRRWFLPVLVAGALAVFWLNNRPDTRHLIIPLDIGLLAGAVVLRDWIRRRPRRLQIVALVVVTAAGLVTWLPFTLTLNTRPSDLHIPAGDYYQYVSGESSGSGLKEALVVLGLQRPQRVLGLLANCWALEYLAEDALPITCPHINPNGSDVEALSALLQESQDEGVFVVLEDVAYIPADSPGTLIANIERPANGPRLRIYALGVSGENHD